jgi:hypothetical protein
LAQSPVATITRLRLHSDLRSGVVAAGTPPPLQVPVKLARPGWARAEPSPGGVRGDSFSGFTETGGGDRGVWGAPSSRRRRLQTEH